MIDRRELNVYYVHERMTFVRAATGAESYTCRGCGQPYPCDATKLADALVAILDSWHPTFDDAQGCDSPRCRAALLALTQAHPTDLYPEDRD